MHRERLLLLHDDHGRRTATPAYDADDVPPPGTAGCSSSRPTSARSRPEWCLNLRDPVDGPVDGLPGDPGDDGRPGYAATASVLRGDERAVVWRRIIELYPFFDHHQKGAAPREIPVVELTRV
jgi:hypothetical protein